MSAGIASPDIIINGREERRSTTETLSPRIFKRVEKDKPELVGRKTMILLGETPLIHERKPDAYGNTTSWVEFFNKNTGTVQTIEVDKPLTIGRASGGKNNMQVGGMEVSGIEHARISPDPRGMLVEAVNSRNGTFVTDLRSLPEERVQITQDTAFEWTGDPLEIQIGGMDGELLLKKDANGIPYILDANNNEIFMQTDGGGSAAVVIREVADGKIVLGDLTTHPYRSRIVVRLGKIIEIDEKDSGLGTSLGLRDMQTKIGERQQGMRKKEADIKARALELIQEHNIISITEHILRGAYPGRNFRLLTSEGTVGIVFEERDSPNIVYKVARPESGIPGQILTEQEIVDFIKNIPVDDNVINYSQKEYSNLQVLANLGLGPQAIDFLSGRKGTSDERSSAVPIIAMEKIVFHEDGLDTISQDRKLQEVARIALLLDSVQKFPGDMQFVYDERRGRVMIIDAGGLQDIQPPLTTTQKMRDRLCFFLGVPKENFGLPQRIPFEPVAAADVVTVQNIAVQKEPVSKFRLNEIREDLMLEKDKNNLDNEIAYWALRGDASGNRRINNSGELQRRGLEAVTDPTRNVTFFVSPEYKHRVEKFVELMGRLEKRLNPFVGNLDYERTGLSVIVASPKYIPASCAAGGGEHILLNGEDGDGAWMHEYTHAYAEKIVGSTALQMAGEGAALYYGNELVPEDPGSNDPINRPGYIDLIFAPLPIEPSHTAFAQDAPASPFINDDREYAYPVGGKFTEYFISTYGENAFWEFYKQTCVRNLRDSLTGELLIDAKGRAVGKQRDIANEAIRRTAKVLQISNLNTERVKNEWNKSG